MNLYWFSEKEGENWTIIVADTKESAWEIYKQDLDGEIVKFDAKNDRIIIRKDCVRDMTYELDSTTQLNGKSGVVASIWPHECDFYIKNKPEMPTAD